MILYRNLLALFMILSVINANSAQEQLIDQFDETFQNSFDGKLMLELNEFYMIDPNKVDYTALEKLMLYGARNGVYVKDRLPISPFLVEAEALRSFEEKDSSTVYCRIFRSLKDSERSMKDELPKIKLWNGKYEISNLRVDNEISIDIKERRVKHARVATIDFASNRQALSRIIIYSFHNVDAEKITKNAVTLEEIRSCFPQSTELKIVK